MHKKLTLVFLVIILSVVFVANCHAQRYKAKFAETDKKFREAMNQAAKETDSKLGGKIDSLLFELRFDVYETFKVSEHDQLNSFKAKQDSLYQKFIMEFISLKAQEMKIDTRRISLHRDSLRISRSGILLTLKSKK